MEFRGVARTRLSGWSDEIQGGVLRVRDLQSRFLGFRGLHHCRMCVCRRAPSAQNCGFSLSGRSANPLNPKPRTLSRSKPPKPCRPDPDPAQIPGSKPQLKRGLKPNALTSQTDPSIAVTQALHTRIPRPRPHLGGNSGWVIRVV